MKDEWWLNGKHCKSGYLVIQSTDSEGFRKCRAARPHGGGIVHGAVYWNVFGQNSDETKAVGEGFSLQDGIYGWNSFTFNAGSNYYHDGRRQMSSVVKQCVKVVLDDWQHNSLLGKTYHVNELLW